jgi:hypothetical protein
MERQAFTRHSFELLQALQGFVPPFWVPVGAKSLAEGNALPALLGTLGGVSIAALGLRRAYAATVSFYRGESGGKKAAASAAPVAAKKIPPGRSPDATGFLERSIPFVPEQSSALALATLRSLLRAPEVKMAWGTSLLITLILGAAFLPHARAGVTDVAKPFIATGAVVFQIFFLAQYFCNQFGFDRDGFRALMLSPADRRLILLGKNLAALPVGLTMGGLMIVLTAVALHLPPPVVLATCLQLASLLLMASIAGNLLSVLIPYRIQPGTMKPTKMPALAMLVLVVGQMFFPVAMLPLFAGPLLEFIWRRMAWPEAVPVNLICSAALLGLMLLIYWLTLAPTGRLLRQRETKILGAITVDVE